MATPKHYTHITFDMRVSIENYVVEGRVPRLRKGVVQANPQGTVRMQRLPQAP